MTLKWRTLLTLVVTIGLVAFVAYGQQLYYPTGNGPVLTKVADLPPGPSILTSLGGTPIPLVSIYAPIFFAEPNTAIRDAAVTACKAGTVAPAQGPGGMPDCTYNGTVAMNADVQKRVLLALETIPVTTMTASKLHLVIP